MIIFMKIVVTDQFWEPFSWLDLFSPDRWFAACWLVSASNCFGDRAVTGGSLVVVADAWSNLESALAPPPNVIQMDRAPVLLRPLKFHAKLRVLVRVILVWLSQRLPPLICKRGGYRLLYQLDGDDLLPSILEALLSIYNLGENFLLTRGGNHWLNCTEVLTALANYSKHDDFGSLQSELISRRWKNANLLIQTINKDACIDPLLLIGSSFDHLQLARKREEHR